MKFNIEAYVSFTFESSEFLFSKILCYEIEEEGSLFVVVSFQTEFFLSSFFRKGLSPSRLSGIRQPRNYSSFFNAISSLPLSYTHTHTHTHPHTHTHTHALILANKLSLSYALSYTHFSSISLSLSLTHTQARICANVSLNFCFCCTQTDAFSLELEPDERSRKEDVFLEKKKKISFVFSVGFRKHVNRWIIF